MLTWSGFMIGALLSSGFLFFPFKGPVETLLLLPSAPAVTEGIDPPVGIQDEGEAGEHHDRCRQHREEQQYCSGTPR